MYQQERLQTGAPGWLSRAAAGAIVAIGFVFVAVNFGIYWARATYMALHPEAVGSRLPTISRSIADPLVGQPFAFWISIAAPLLFLGVAAIIAVQLSAAGTVAPHAPRTALVLRICAALVLPLQALACIGMVTLSQYTFPRYNAEHMLGSYMFFGAQALVVLLGLVSSGAIAASGAARTAIAQAGLVHPGANRLRLIVGSGSVVLVAAYAALFFGKDIDLGGWDGAIYYSYVMTEPACISSFLLFMVTYNLDLWRVARADRRAPLAEEQNA